MIKKITAIKAIGKFKNYESSDLGLKALTGIYSENGRGKTTISSILRSLSKNNPKIILGRRRLNEIEKPYFKMELESGFIEFKDGAWSRPYSDIEIFDSHFINENLYSGMQVDLNQKRNLYKFIIGDEAVKINTEVVALNDKISDTTSDVREKRTQITKLIGAEIEVSDFVKLEPISDIDSKILAKEKEVVALQKRDLLTKKEHLEIILFPAYDLDALGTLLEISLEDVSKDSESMVKLHVKNCLSETGEEWLRAGVQQLGVGSECPFCKSDISTNDLILSYRSYFNIEYNSLKEKLATEATSFKKSFTETLIANAVNKIKNNLTLAQSWKEYLEIPPIENPDQKDSEDVVNAKIHNLNIENVNQLSIAFTNISDLIEKKRAAPLDVCDEDVAAYRKLNNQIKNVFDEIKLYNSQVGKINVVLDLFKKGLTSSDLGTEKAGLSKLRAAKNRYIEGIKTQCDDYIELEARKTILEKEKEIARGKLDDLTKKVPEQYQEKINGYLEKFGADFRIYDHKKVNPRGEPATEYKILINGAEVPVGDVNSPEEVASFKNTLSEGDKNTLAFCYFLAKIDSDIRINEKILIFDDPISSLDSSRREWTKSYLKYYGGRAKQLIILSHDSRFLEEMHVEIKKSQKEMCCLKITVSEGGSSFEKVNFSDLNKTSHLRNLEAIQNYANAGVGIPANVIKAIRPICEDYIKDYCPNSISSNDNLGGMIRKIRESSEASDLAALKPLLIELENLNAYSAKEHHGQDGSSGPIDENQLRAQARLTLKITKE